MVLHVISYVKSSSAPSKTKMADHAQNGLEITFKVINFYSESCREMGCQGWGGLTPPSNFTNWKMCVNFEDNK